MLLTITNVFLCIAALAFPFSVAASNVSLGAVLVLGIVSGFWWQGGRQCWASSRNLILALCAYFLLMILGLAWSLDMDWGLHIIMRQWFWLLIPIIVVLLAEERWRKYFLVSLSIGLMLNLIFCVLQMYDYVSVTTLGSSADDATGHIGHIGFGVVYGIWASWLLYLGWQWQGKVRWLVWSIAAWSYVMIFAAQGRSGYIVAFMLALAVDAKCSTGYSKSKRMILMVVIPILLLGAVLAIGPAKERFQGAWMASTEEQQESKVEIGASQRIMMWKTTLDIYRLHPVFGVGTGGLPHAVAELKAAGHSAAQFNFVHPHNQYLLVLVRWGPVGVVLLLFLLYFWVREGWRRDWRESVAAPLIFLAPLALAVHGLSSSSMEEHFSAILAILLLGVALSDNKDDVKEGG